MKRHATGILLAATMALASPAFAQDIEIGIIAPMSGPAATYGTDIMNGLNLAASSQRLTM